MKASDLFVKVLEEENVEYIFGIPGEENLDFLDSLRKTKIKFIITRNEQTAVFMAANYGRFTGKPGVALSTLGPGATNLMTGVGYAQLNGIPVILITGQKPIKKSKQGEFQVIDVVSMMRPLTKMAKQIVSADRIPSLLRQAFKSAIAERPGVVHLEFPEDIAREHTKAKILKQKSIRRPIVEDKAYNQLLSSLKKSKRPIILIGAGANRKRVTKYVTEFIQKYNIPFFNSQMGKGVVDERLSQFVGTAAVSDGDAVHEVIKKADLILAIGHDTIEKPTNFICESKNKTNLIHINFYEANIDDIYVPDLEVIGDIGNLFWRLSQENIVFNSKTNELLEFYKKTKQSPANNNTKKNMSGKLTPNELIDTLRNTLAEEDIVALDNGWYKLWFARNYLVYKPNTLLLDNTFATMGAGMPSGIAAKMLNPSNKVVVVTGDGGLVMNLGDLETAVRLNLDMLIIVLKNNSYGMIKEKQKGMGFKEFSLEFSNPDFVKLAESFGATGWKINHVTDLKQKLPKILNKKGVKLLEIPITYPKFIN